MRVFEPRRLTRVFEFLYARRTWHRPWLWDIAATLGVVNAFVSPALVRGRVPTGTEGVLSLLAFAATIAAVISIGALIDRRVGERLPELHGAESGFVLVKLPATVVFVYVSVLLVADLLVWHSFSDLLVTGLVLVAANAAALAGCTWQVARRVAPSA